ncbi:methyl-accepting chemotaxis protein [Alishewanella sp. BS5-314]|uniref:methyl-accepting chemotaxis protein n=1 Tax=Alishewanella sp. BS5-314 TaxID=2755587 RepID=UPI0021BB89EF|nr:methyl-accepting chemotaxis protein [Alishewanella sp. BS5-314]MCT8125978.1 methyl-accepting chemotaxis protein [Alishewanella sp. BS5-314]
MVRQLKIGLRATLAFALLGLITLILGIIAISQFHQTGQVVGTLVERRVPAAITVGELRRDFLLTRLHTLNAIYAPNPQARQQALTQLTELEQSFNASYEKMRRLVESAEGRQMLEAVMTGKRNYDVQHARLMEFVRAGDFARADSFRHEGFTELGFQVTDALNQLGRYQQTRAEAAGTDVYSIINQANTMMITAIVIAVGLVALFAFVFSRSLLQPINQALSATETIAKGDLTQHFDDQSRDEMAAMIRALVQMQQQLKHTIVAINDSSNQLSTTAEELSVVTEQSTRVLHQQSDELEQAATAVTELTTAVEEVARNAAATSQNSELAEEQAKSGRDKVKHTIATVAELEHEITNTRQGVQTLAERVTSISRVLDVIRAIAEQTNLLALNAAIEAARAGDSGRGFAVVADEVRALAHRTQESTKEIESMMHAIQAETSNTVKAISVSAEKADRTRQIAHEAGAALEQIAASVLQINEQNLTIASAAEQQATVAREVDKNLVNIRDLSLQTSSGANQTSASSNELAKLAEQLHILVQKFRI